MLTSKLRTITIRSDNSREKSKAITIGSDNYSPHTVYKVLCNNAKT
jgi:hypothetical protein